MQAKKFLKNLSLYTLEPVVFKLVSFLLIPIYTAYLLPQEFGDLQYIISIATFLKSITTFGLSTAFWKFRSDLEEKEYASLSTNIIVSQFFIGSLICSILVIIYLSGFNSMASVGLILYFTALLIKTFSENYLLICRAYNKVNLYLSISILQTLLFFGLNYYFLSQTNLKTNGVVLAYLIAFVLITIAFFPILRYKVFGKINLSQIKRLLHFGGPLLLGNLSILVMSISDRWFLKTLSTEAELGLYSYGYKFSDLIATFFIYTFQLAWTPIAWKAFSTEQGRSFFFKVERIIMVFFPSIIFLIIPFILLLARIMTVNPEFNKGLNIIYIIAFSHIFYAYYTFNSVKNLYYNKKKNIIKANIASASFNLLLNILLIGKFGMWGAAIATVLSYILMYIIIEFVQIPELDQFKAKRHKLFIFNGISFILVITNTACMLFFDSLMYITPVSFVSAGILVGMIYLLRLNDINLKDLMNKKAF
ncbi:MAG: oligosaccharide flippase family protein [Bacteroidia bacterium]|nr:oligosaccharide flippase family protein [Bacteroidia bacterium]